MQIALGVSWKEKRATNTDATNLIHKHLLPCLICCAMPVVSFAQLDKDTLLSAWDNSVTQLSSKAITLRGSWKLSTPESAPSESSGKWEYSTSDSAYSTMFWGADGKPVRSQSFDGTLWRGVTYSAKESLCSIYKQPKANFGLDIEESLESLAPVYPFTLRQMLQKPMRIPGDVNLLERCRQTLDNATLTSETKNDKQTLTFNTVASPGVLNPKAITLKSYGSGFLPEAISYEQKSNGRVVRQLIDFRYKQLGELYYPSSITTTITITNGDVTKTVQTLIQDLEFSNLSTKSSFQATFPEGCHIFDERELIVKTQPKARPYALYIGAGALVLSLLGLFGGIKAWRQRNA